jgi:hypothetical protein
MSRLVAPSLRIPTRTVFWATGNTASPLGRTLGVPLTKTGQVIVEHYLSIPGRPESLRDQGPRARCGGAVDYDPLPYAANAPAEVLVTASVAGNSRSQPPW